MIRQQGYGQPLKKQHQIQRIENLLNMKVLLIGSGGREHALAWKIARSPLLEKLYIAPGNAGTAMEGENISLAVDNFNALAAFIKDKQIDLLLVGPEQPLADGLRDDLEGRPGLESLMIIGPAKAGARLESSKDFAKAFMLTHGIPCAASRSFTRAQLPEGLAWLAENKGPYVLKADGLAAGKGVIITADLEEAQETLRAMLQDAMFGDASNTVVIEEFLQGIELSVFVLTDGKDYLLLPEAKDYKRIGEGDTGPNTGGMGSVSPVPFADKAFLEKVESRIIKPTLAGLQQESIPYKGFIFFGLMNVGGDPFVIEYNVRMGDPETQSVIPRIESDLLPLLAAAARGELGHQSLHISPDYCCSVILASGGYPEAYEKDKLVTGLSETGDVLVFHAGTRLDEEKKIRTSGGRVLSLTARGPSLAEALSSVYEASCQVHFDQRYFRRDIGKDL